MSLWDVFHAERLEVERGLTAARVREALAQGELTENDLIRPAGSGEPYARLSDFAGVLEAEEARAPQPPAAGPGPETRAIAPTEPWVEPLPQSGSFERQAAGTFPPVRGEDEPPARPPTKPAPIDDLPVPAEEFAPPSFEFEDAATEADLSRFEPDADADASTTRAAMPPGDEFAPPTLDALMDDEEDEPEILDALVDEDDDEEEEEEKPGVLEALIDDDELGELDLNLDRRSALALPLGDEAGDARLSWAEIEGDGPEGDEYDPEEEDEAAAEFTLARGAAETVEELDLAAMVDVAFQLVLFFLVTATTVLYKSLEVPKPNPESAAPGAASQGTGKTLDDLQADYILVDITPAGEFRIDREPAPAQVDALAERMRAARTATGRTAMLLTADFTTHHRYAVMAYDAANEIGLRIAIAKPAQAGGAPAAPPAAKAAGSG